MRAAPCPGLPQRRRNRARAPQKRRWRAAACPGTCFELAAAARDSARWGRPLSSSTRTRREIGGPSGGPAQRSCWGSARARFVAHVIEPQGRVEEEAEHEARGAFQLWVKNTHTFFEENTVFCTLSLTEPLVVSVDGREKSCDTNCVTSGIKCFRFKSHNH